MSFVDGQMEIKNVPLLSTPNQLSVAFIHILRVFYHLLIGLVPSIHSFMDTFRYAPVGLNYLLNYLFSKLIFLENGHPENVINRCFKRFMDSIHVLKETTLTVESKPLVFSSLKLENGLEKQVLNGA